MPLLTREQILAAQDLPMETVSVPEWGGDVMVRTLTGSERDQFEKLIITQQGKRAVQNLDNLRAKLCSVSICDEQGNRLFSQADIETLGKKSSLALQRVFEVAMKLSGFSQEDLEELTKN